VLEVAVRKRWPSTEDASQSFCAAGGVDWWGFGGWDLEGDEGVEGGDEGLSVVRTVL